MEKKSLGRRWNGIEGVGEREGKGCETMRGGEGIL